MPTPVVHTRLRAPSSRMGPADDVAAVAAASPLAAKYAERVDPESARELLAERVERRAQARDDTPAPKKSGPVRKRAAPRSSGGGDPLTDLLGSRAGRQIQREVVHGVFGMLRKRL